MLTNHDIEMYRANYSKEWLGRPSDGYYIKHFPCVGAVHSIHALCDEIEELHKLLDTIKWNLKYPDDEELFQTIQNIIKDT